MDDDAFSASPWADVPSSPKPQADTGSARTSLEASKLSTAVVPEVEARQSVELKDDAPWGQDSPPPTESKGLSGIMAAFDDSDDEAAEPAMALPTFAESREAESDFDDFDEPMDGNDGFQTGENVGDDDFGDFGDFEEGDEEVHALEPEVEPIVVAQEALQSLRLDPFPSTSSLAQQIADLLEPLFPNASASLTDEPLRQVGGLGQIMSSDSSREAYAQLTTPPMLKPLDWTRSRTRREHLISLGVPVNLDEVDSHRLTALPPLTITTAGYRPPPAERSYTAAEKGKGKAPELLSEETERKEQARQKESYGLGRKPDFNQAKADELLDIAEERLSIMPRAVLERIQKDLVETSAQASALLAHLLQLKDAQANDSVTYNGLISELISNAQKMKAASTAASGGGVFRKSSVRKSTGPGSGASTPRRTASPSLW